MKILGKKTVIASALLAAVGTTDIKSILGDSDFNLGVSNAIAGEQVEKNKGEVIHINSPTEIAEKWSPEDIFYVQGNIPISDNVLKALTQKINKEYPDTQYTFFFMGDNPSNFSYKNRDGNNLKGKDAVEFALSESLLGKTELGIGKKHVVIYITFKKDNKGKRWIKPLTSSEFDKLGIGEQSNFSKETGPLFSKVFPQLKNGNFPGAIKIITDGYDNRYKQIISQREATEKRQKEQFKQNKNNAEKGVVKIKGLYKDLAKRYEIFLGKKPIIDWDREIINCIIEAENLLNENPGQSLKILNNAIKIIGDYEKLIRTYHSYGEEISSYGEKIEKINKDKFSNKAKQEYEIANNLHKKALGEWKNKDFSYINTCKQLAVTIEEFKKKVKHAEKAQLTKDIATKGGGSLALLLTGIAGFLANRKRKVTKEEFERELSRWQETLNKAHSELLDEIDDKEEILSMLFDDSKGETKDKIDKLSEDVWGLSVMLPKLNDTLKQIEKEVGSDIGVNLFSGKGYREGLSLLKKEEISINPTLDRLDEHLLKVLGKQRINTLSESADFMTYTFEGMINEADRRIKDIRNIFGEFDEANSNFEKKIETSLDLKGQLEISLDFLCQNIGEESIDTFPYITEFLNNFDSNIDKISKLALLDKLGSYNVILEINKKIELFIEVIKEINDFVKENDPYKDKIELDLDSYDTMWFAGEIDKAYKGLGKESRKIFSFDTDVSSFTESIDFKVDKIIEVYNKLKELNIVSNKKEELDEVIERLASEIEELKNSLSKDYNIESNLLFREKDHYPDNRFNKIDSLKIEVKKLLDDGNEDEAEKKLSQIKDLLSELKMIISMTKSGFEVYDPRKNKIHSVSQNISVQKVKASELLESIKEKWSLEVLKLGEGDITHPDSDGNLENNIIEIDKNQTNLIRVLEEADSSRENGASISAIGELDRAKAINEDSQYRLKEIKEKYDRLETTDAENTDLLSEVDSSLEKIANIQDNAYVTEKSKDGFINILSLKTQVETRALEEKRNPFKINEELKELLNGIKELDNSIKRDKQAYEYFVKRVATIDTLITQLEIESEEARYDNYPDSVEARKVFQIITPKRREDYKYLVKILDKKHEDWHSLLSVSEEVIEQINIAINILREDTIERQEVEKDINKARNKIEDARRWSGSYGISIYGHYGISDLSRAEEAYSKGNFDEANNYANIAYRNAINAIEKAEEAVRRERMHREEEERRQREEEARRAREAAARAERARESSSSSWSTSSLSGFGGGGSFSSSSSGFGGGGSW